MTPLALRQALRMLDAHRLWAALTMFGVVWGSTAIVVLNGWGEGFRLMLEDALAKTGKNLVYVWVGRVSEAYRPASDRRNLWLTVSDLSAVKRRARIPDAIAGESSSWSVLSNGARTAVVDVRGIEPSTFAIRGVSLQSGDILRQHDLDRRRRVVVLGATTKERLFGPSRAVDARIRLAGLLYEVVGVLAPVGTELARDRTPIDEQAWIPLTTLFSNGPRYGTDIEIVDMVLFRIPNVYVYDRAVSEMRGIMADRIGVSPSDPEALIFVSPLDALRKMPLRETSSYLDIVASGTLLIAGFGVMNMMLVAVQDRRREIGTRLAIGARPSDILLEILAETLSVCLLGGALGIALGLVACAVLGALDVPELVPIPVVIPHVVARAVLLLVAVGVAAGIAPAWRAARVPPSVSLRIA